MNKWIAIVIPIIFVLAIGVIVTGALYSQESAKVKDAQHEIVGLEENVSTLEGRVSALEADLADREAIVLALEAELLVTFPDANLETVIREALNKPTGPIYRSDVESLATLEDHSLEVELSVLRIIQNISDLTGLEYCVNLEMLDFGGRYLGEEGGITVRYISDLSALACLTNLQELYLNDNDISDISALAGLTNLRWLELNSNNISDISPVTGLSNLQELELRENNISDISPLVENSGLSAGDTVNLSNNPLSAESINVYIPQLEARGVDVYY